MTQNHNTLFLPVTFALPEIPKWDLNTQRSFLITVNFDLFRTQSGKPHKTMTTLFVIAQHITHAFLSAHQNDIDNEQLGLSDDHSAFVDLIAQQENITPHHILLSGALKATPIPTLFLPHTGTNLRFSFHRKHLRTEFLCQWTHRFDSGQWRENDFNTAFPGWTIKKHHANPVETPKPHQTLENLLERLDTPQHLSEAFGFVQALMDNKKPMTQEGWLNTITVMSAHRIGMGDTKTGTPTANTVHKTLNTLFGAGVFHFHAPTGESLIEKGRRLGDTQILLSERNPTHDTDVIRGVEIAQAANRLRHHPRTLAMLAFQQHVEKALTQHGQKKGKQQNLVQNNSNEHWERWCNIMEQHSLSLTQPLTKHSQISLEKALQSLNIAQNPIRITT